MPHRLAAILALAAALLVASPAAAAGEATPPADLLLELTNATRADHALAPLTVDPGLAATAGSHAAAMRAAGRIHHSGARASGDGVWRFAENVGAGHDVEAVHAAFLASPSHRAALLGEFDRIGVGVAAEGIRVWVVVQFASLRHPEPATVPAGGDGIALVDPATARWDLPGGRAVTYGNPGDHPIAGDWDCDGVDTPGLYRRRDGYVYLRNSATTGIAHVRFYFGDPGDLPVAGDFDGDGCDTVALYRPATGRLHVIDELGGEERGLGAADRSLATGVVGGAPLAGDLDGDGIDDPAVHDPATGQVVARLSSGGRVVRAFGDPGDLLVAGDWDGDGRAAFAALRRSTGVVHVEGLEPGVMVVARAAAVQPVAGSFGR